MVFHSFLSQPLLAQYQITDNCIQAWEAIIDLRLVTADSLINAELAENPNNYYVYYLAQTCDAYELMINNSTEVYEKLIPKYEERISMMEDHDVDSPHYLTCIAEMQLQMGMFNIIHGDKLSGLRRAYGAYKKTYRNIDKNPDYQTSYKLDGIFDVALLNLPPFVSWAANAFGVSGDEKKGYATLNNYFIYCSNLEGLKQEAALYNILAFKLNKDPQSAYEFISTLDSGYFNYKLLSYFKANVAFRCGKNEEALLVLSTFDNENMEVQFNGYNYLFGKILLRKLDPSAIGYFKKYLTNKPEEQYLKEIHYALALSYLIAGDKEKFTKHKQLAYELGSEIAERDREAMYDCSLDYFPDVNLVRAKLSLDGGYNDVARNWLEIFRSAQNDKDSPSPYNLEYWLLKGKLEFVEGNTNEAISLLSKVVTLGKNEDYYFASEAALQLGIIYKNTDPDKALSYFKLARDLYVIDYYEYIDEISKKRIRDLSR